MSERRDNQQQQQWEDAGGRGVQDKDTTRSHLNLPPTKGTSDGMSPGPGPQPMSGLSLDAWLPSSDAAPGPTPGLGHQRQGAAPAADAAAATSTVVQHGAAAAAASVFKGAVAEAASQGAQDVARRVRDNQQPGGEKLTYECINSMLWMLDPRRLVWSVQIEYGTLLAIAPAAPSSSSGKPLSETRQALVRCMQRALQPDEAVIRSALSGAKLPWGCYHDGYWPALQGTGAAYKDPDELIMPVVESTLRAAMAKLRDCLPPPAAPQERRQEADVTVAAAAAAAAGPSTATWDADGGSAESEAMDTHSTSAVEGGCGSKQTGGEDTKVCSSLGPASSKAHPPPSHAEGVDKQGLQSFSALSLNPGPKSSRAAGATAGPTAHLTAAASAAAAAAAAAEAELAAAVAWGLFHVTKQLPFVVQGDGAFSNGNTDKTMQLLNMCHTKLREALDPDTVLWEPSTWRNGGRTPVRRGKMGAKAVPEKQRRQWHRAMHVALLDNLAVCERMVHAVFKDCILDPVEHSKCKMAVQGALYWAVGRLRGDLQAQAAAAAAAAPKPP